MLVATEMEGSLQQGSAMAIAKRFNMDRPHHISIMGKSIEHACHGHN